MRVWLATIGEPVPVSEGSKDRLHRTGQFAHLLADREHEVVWWTSTFNHFQKSHLFEEDTTLRSSERLEIRLLHGCGYRRNVSPARFRDHYQIGRKFAAMIEKEPIPDVIVAALPTIELSAFSAEYGRRHGIPVVVDIRDLWPDIFVDVVPSPARWAARLALGPLFRRTRAALSRCTSIIGVSEGYLDWGLRYADRQRRETDAVFPLGYSRPVRSEADFRDASASLVARGVDPRKTICWFVGMFGRTYDLLTVIEAARVLQAREAQDIQFVLSGQGDDYEKLLHEARGLPNVVFTGWINAPQIAWLMGAAKIGLMAYAKGAPQGYPNKLFEYMAAGIPIVSCLLGETESLLRDGDCGLTYQPQDARELVAAVESLAGDEARRRQMARNCLRLFETRFQAEKIYDEMIVHLERLVRRNDQTTIGMTRAA
jgi:glycosyltransferase involved in cell wall biosynthesis